MKIRLIRFFMVLSSILLFVLILPVLLVHLSGCSESLKAADSAAPNEVSEIRDIDTHLDSDPLDR